MFSSANIIEHVLSEIHCAGTTSQDTLQFEKCWKEELLRVVMSSQKQIKTWAWDSLTTADVDINAACIWTHTQHWSVSGKQHGGRLKRNGRELLPARELAGNPGKDFIWTFNWIAGLKISAVNLQRMLKIFVCSHATPLEHLSNIPGLQCYV